MTSRQISDELEGLALTIKPMTPLHNTVIYLLGFAGVGKYTIAKELQRLTGAKVIDNHYILNPIFGLIQQDGITPLPAKVWDYCWQVHHAVFGTIRELSPKDWSFIFTNGLIEGDEESQGLYANIASLAAHRGSLFVPVRLQCEVEELTRRIVRPERRERMKEVSVEGARERFATQEVFKPDHPNTLTLDTTQLQPHQSAEAILEHIAGLELQQR